MAKKTRRKFTVAFKKAAVKKIISGKASIASLSRELLVDVSVLHRWSKDETFLTDKIKNGKIAKKPTKFSKRYTDAEKRDIVNDVLSGSSVAKASLKHGVDSTSIYNWLRDDNINPSAKQQVERASGLPTMTATKPRKARPLIAVMFQCPHCSGPIEVQ